MIVGLLELLSDARRCRSAVFSFGCYDAESTAGLLTAANGRPVVLLISSQLVAAPGGELIVSALRAMAERARSPVCLQLDHAHHLDAIGMACDWGVNAVMADGSRGDLEANVNFVRQARRIAAPHGVAVEAQLGTLAGNEEVALEAASEDLTDPEEAARFFAESEPDCLGVSVGNVHGIYRERPQLDLERIRAIAARVGVPLALHGGSGLSPAVITGAIRAGISKVNFNADLREAYLARTERELPTARPGARLLALHRGQMKAVQAIAADKLMILDPPEWMMLDGVGRPGDGPPAAQPLVRGAP